MMDWNWFSVGEVYEDKKTHRTYEVKECGSDSELIGNMHDPTYEAVRPFDWAEAQEVFFDDDSNIIGYGDDWVYIERTADYPCKYDSINNYYML